MDRKSDADIALEISQSIYQNKDRQKRLMSSTFWRLFSVKARQKTVVEKIVRILDNQGLKVSVKSGDVLGEEQEDDWIILTPKMYPPETPPEDPIPLSWPASEWFQRMQTRAFESEREVETYFIAPLLEELGYEYDDIAIGYSVDTFKGVRRTKTEADFALFNGPNREREDVLLVVEAKKSDKNITADNIGQARFYAQELMPACYIVTNGQQIMVFRFNGTLIPDERVMDFNRMMLNEMWAKLYGYASREATIKRKSWMQQIVLEAKGG